MQSDIRMTHDLLFATIPNDVQSLGQALLGTAAFGMVGIVLMIAGFKLFEAVTRKLDIEKQLDNQNMAVGIVVGSTSFESLMSIGSGFVRAGIKRIRRYMDDLILPGTAEGFRSCSSTMLTLRQPCLKLLSCSGIGSNRSIRIWISSIACTSN